LIYRFDECVLDTERRELRRGGVLLAIEPQVFDLLEYLLRSRERVVGRDELLQAISRGHLVSEQVLSTRINAARAAIGDSGSEQRLIRTFRGTGFRFIAAAQEQKPGLSRFADIIANRPLLALRLAGAPAITVLPFDIVTVDSCDARVADGLTEEIILSLSKLGWLSVVSRNTSVSYKGVRVDSKELASRLGVRFLLQGCIRQAQGRVRVAVELVDGLSDHQIWAERYERDVRDIFAVQDDIAAHVADAVADALFAAENIRARLKSPQSLNTWQCIVRALSLMNTRRRPQLRAAERLIRRAIAIDPRCAPAYGLLSFLHTLRLHLGWQLREATSPVAVDAARKAVALDGEEPWGYVALGYASLFKLMRPVEAIAALEAGLRLDANLSIAHYLTALSSVYAGDCNKALRHAQMAAELAPHDLLARGNAGAPNNVRSTINLILGRYRDGIEFARKAISQSPRQLPAFRLLAFNCAFAGELEEASHVIKRVNRLAPDTEQWVKETEKMWSRREDYAKYVDAFRVASSSIGGVWLAVTQASQLFVEFAAETSSLFLAA
jgi:TolB-like protein